MGKRWRILPHDPGRITSLARAAGIPAVVAQLLISRGVTDPGLARQFLDPKLSGLYDPSLLPGCTDAARIVHQAVEAGKRIVVYGDYDVDGISGTAVLWKCLRMLNADAGYYVPHRMDEGYGLNLDAIRRIASQDAQLLVTVDCGVTSVDEVSGAADCGMNVVITDHHEPEAILPHAAAIVHPRLPGHSYPFPGLSGSGVALKLAWGICQQASGTTRVHDRMREFLVQAVGLAALGTIADVVPLVDENRILVRHGLVSLKEKPTLGLATLMKVAGLDDKRRLDAEDIGFALGPRLNAAGRLGQAQLAVELLVTDRPDRAKELAQYVDGLNQSRQTLELSIYKAAQKQAKEQFDLESDPALVLADHGWHPGVIGIVAGRLADKYHLPVVVVAWDRLGVKPGTGSARSVPGFDLYKALEACSEHLVSYGGHAAAAGLRIHQDQIDAFRADFCLHAAEQLSEEERIAELTIDAEAPLSAFTLKVASQIEQLAPFGQDNARPLMCASGVMLAAPPKQIGNGGRHLSVQLRQHDITLRAVAFGGGEWSEELCRVDGPLEVAFRPVINTFRGRRSVELHLVDWRAAGVERT